MSIITDPFFGGAERKAAKAERVELRKGQDIIKQGKARARGDLTTIFPQAGESLRGGFQGALDVFGQALPQQAQAFQGGNIEAQQTLVNSLPQLQNAILGNPVNFGGFNASQQQLPNLGFANQQLPERAVNTQPAVNTQRLNFMPDKFDGLNFGKFGFQGRGIR